VTIKLERNSLKKLAVIGLIILPFICFINDGRGKNNSAIAINPNQLPVITTSTVVGTIQGCEGTASASPNIGQFTVAGTFLIGDITLTPPADFDISLTAVGGYSRSLVIKQVAGAVISTTIYVRSAAGATGNILGSVTITTPGANPSTVPLTGSVNPLPTINTVNNQTFNAGTASSPINFTGTGDVYTWTNNNPAIGLPATGTGNISSFIPSNGSGSAVVASITVTPNNSNTGCSGTPISFNITINPAAVQPGINAGNVSGTIAACAGTASIDPNILQFSVSGSALNGNITATVSAGFEISLTPTSGYGNNLIIAENGGTVNNTNIYIRSAASASGNINGNVVLSSPGVPGQSIPVSGTVFAIPGINTIPDIVKTAGAVIPTIQITGTGAVYTWANDSPGIGLPANGSGDIPTFTAINTGATPIKATITVLGSTNTNPACSSAPLAFTITINPAPLPTLSANASLKGFVTTYGSASAAQSFQVSGNNLSGAIQISAPPGFEISTDNNSFSNSLTLSNTGTVNAISIYLRLAAATAAGNSYTGDIILASNGTPDVKISIPNSIVNKALLIITADDISKAQGTPNPSFTFTYTGFQNGDQPSQLTKLPVATTIADIYSDVGSYIINLGGAESPNYSFQYNTGILNVLASLQFVTIPNAFTPNGDGINDLWNIPQLVNFPDCTVSIYSRYGNLVFQSHGYPRPWDGTSKGASVPTGTYYYVIESGLNGLKPLSGYVAVLH